MPDTFRRLHHVLSLVAVIRPAYWTLVHSARALPLVASPARASSLNRSCFAMDRFLSSWCSQSTAAEPPVEEPRTSTRSASGGPRWPCLSSQMGEVKVEARGGTPSFLYRRRRSLSACMSERQGTRTLRPLIAQSRTCANLAAYADASAWRDTVSKQTCPRTHCEEDC